VVGVGEVWWAVQRVVGISWVWHGQHAHGVGGTIGGQGGGGGPCGEVRV